MTAALRIGLLGLGTVGQGVVRVLNRNSEEITRRAGRPMRITRAAVRQLDRVRDGDYGGIELSADPFDVVRAPDVDVVVELLGGMTPARELVLEAIDRRKHVVTANKALIAEGGNELFAAAQAKHVMIAYEAAVAGGIPIIKAVREGLSGNRILSLAGIVNGTCNYILTQMSDKGVAFADALAEAQRLGYAEADPSFDVDGIDAAHKLSILAAIAFGIPLSFKRVAVEGIRGVSAQDIQLARELGYRVKLLGIAKRTGLGVELRVHPTLIADYHLLAKVDGVLNSVVVEGDAVGRTGYYGPGAGGDATASAVLADLVDVARHIGAPHQHQVPPLAFQSGAIQDLPIVPIRDIQSAYYLRLQVADEPGVLMKISAILAEAGISIEAIIQKEPRGNADATIALLTSAVPEHRFDTAVRRMQLLPFVRPGLSRFRVEKL